MGVLLKETAAIVAADLDAKDQRLVLDLGAMNGAIVNGDGARLQQVFWNLLKNAVKFSAPKSPIGFTARAVEKPTPRVVIEVKDTGVGIDPANLDRIFQPFEQVVAHSKQRNGDSGLGLGLTIAKAIVELHHGSIRAISSGIGQGATFIVELPLVADAQREPKILPPRPPANKAGDDTRSMRILLVEDHCDTGRILTRLLRNAGYGVEYSETAAGALERADDSKFDLVISDLGLPDASGLELMPKLRAKQPWLRGICLSGYGTEDDLRACRDAGFAEHLTKPVDIQRLHAAIARVAAAVEA
jgi:CheY-like chemotaxis protein